MHDPALATAADYADAMLTARRAKNVVVLFLLLLILAQLTVFFLVRFDVISIGVINSVAAATMPASQPSVNTINKVHYVTSGFLYLGVTLSVVLSFVLLLIVNIMLVGRLIGVARVTSAYLWCLILVLLLFPWQSFLNNVGLTLDQATFKVPGVLYSWTEFSDPVNGAKFNGETSLLVVKWARFAAFPFLAVIILLVIQVKSNRGIRQALGEDEAITLPADNNT